MMCPDTDEVGSASATECKPLSITGQRNNISTPAASNCKLTHVACYTSGLNEEEKGCGLGPTKNSAQINNRHYYTLTRETAMIGLNHQPKVLYD